MKNNRYNMEENITLKDLCYNYQKIRKHIFVNDYFNKYISLKMSSGFDESTDEQIKKEYNYNKNKFNSLANDVNMIMSKL